MAQRRAAAAAAAAAARAESLFLHELRQSTAAHGADCGLGGATDYSQSCSRRLPPKVRCDQARGSLARHTAAHPARHRCTAYHLAGIPRVRPLPSADSRNSYAHGAADHFAGHPDTPSATAPEPPAPRDALEPPTPRRTPTSAFSSLLRNPSIPTSRAFMHSKESPPAVGAPRWPQASAWEVRAPAAR